MTNGVWRSRGLDCLTINEYAKFHQNIQHASRTYVTHENMMSYVRIYVTREKMTFLVKTDVTTFGAACVGKNILDR